MTKDVKEFLEESNKIEGVSDPDSLQQAKYAWTYLIRQRVLTVSVILKTHKILMLHQNLYPNQKGYFRTVPVWVGGREGADHEEVPGLMSHWALEGMQASPVLTEEDIKQLHIKYEKIHPFIDGNGRTGRMFMNYQRTKRARLPILIIHAGKEQHEYYKWFI